ncbi:hypothetical protein AX15_002315 [Amanita polypyramis BW_CC]|nr:hypothetical protein AX15_002315 [Amanita polypyramis BW_CC]
MASVRLFDVLLLLFLVLLAPALVIEDIQSKPPALQRSRYSKAYSLGDSYNFDPRDGWQFVNISNRAYKDNQIQAQYLNSRDYKNPQRGNKPKGTKQEGLADHFANFLDDVFRRLKGLGSFTPVTITWYTKNI